MGKIKLSVELIPASCYYSNVRSMVTTQQWNTLRKYSYQQAKNKCKICKGIGTLQGFRYNLECHEVWEYDDVNQIQKLISLDALCPNCHLAKHIGRANAMGKQPVIFKHMETVNKWNHKQVVEHVGEAFLVNSKRSKLEWTLDLTLLTQAPYDLKIDPDKKRKFAKKKRYKKKRKR